MMVKKTVLALSILLCAFSVDAQIVWKTNMKETQALATRENKLILIKFSGSDWCGPCIAINRNVFDTSEFEEFSLNNLELISVDFPRLKKNQLSKELQSQNDELAEKYNKEGNFPLIVLTDAQGKVLHQWSGYNKKLTVTDYINEIYRYIK